MVGTLALIVLVVALLIFLNALYVAGEFSFVSARKPRIQQLAEQGNRNARVLLPILKDAEHLDNYIAASQVGITLSSLVLGIYGEQQISPRLEPLLASLLGRTGQVELAAASITAALVLITLTILQMVLGELVPKSFGVQFPERLALLTVRPMKWSAEFLLRPLIILLNGSGRVLLRLFGLHENPVHAHIHSPEEIVILVQESARSGLIDADERQMLRNVFRVSETTAGEIAIPRPRIVAVEVNQPLREALEMAARSSFSRIPVYENSIDHILGYIHLKDLFHLYRLDPHGSLRSGIRQAPFVPQSLTAIEVWNRLNETRSFLAFVIDEYGGTAGMITREDLIEELFGELQDEFDQEPALYRRLGENQYRVRGELSISALNDLLGTRLARENVNTVSGLIEEALGRIPEPGDHLDLAGVCFDVEDVHHAVVRWVTVRLAPEQAGSEPAEGEG